MGTKISATTSIIFKVSGLPEALKAVKLYLGLIVEGNMFGKSPTTPKSAAVPIVTADANQAFQ